LGKLVFGLNWRVIGFSYPLDFDASVYYTEEVDIHVSVKREK